MKTNPLQLSMLALLLTAPAFAQTNNNFSLYRGFENAEGSTGSSRFLQYANGRTQVIEPGLNDNVARTLLSVATRLDGPRFYSASNGMGRTWTDFRVRVGDKAATPSRSFAGNVAGALTQVFSGKVTFPTIPSTFRGKSPEPCGGANGE